MTVEEQPLAETLGYSIDQATAMLITIQSALTQAKLFYRACPLDDAIDLEILITNLEDCEDGANDIVNAIKAINPATVDIRPDDPN